MSASTRNLRTLLSLWLNLHDKQGKCDECTAPAEQCEKHAPDLAKVADATRKALEAN